MVRFILGVRAFAPLRERRVSKIVAILIPALVATDADA